MKWCQELAISVELKTDNNFIIKKTARATASRANLDSNNSLRVMSPDDESRGTGVSN